LVTAIGAILSGAIVIVAALRGVVLSPRLSTARRWLLGTALLMMGAMLVMTGAVPILVMTGAFAILPFSDPVSVFATSLLLAAGLTAADAVADAPAARLSRSGTVPPFRNSGPGGGGSPYS
jgi:hypothetical protein